MIMLLELRQQLVSELHQDFAAKVFSFERRKDDCCIMTNISYVFLYCPFFFFFEILIICDTEVLKIIFVNFYQIMCVAQKNPVSQKQFCVSVHWLTVCSYFPLFRINLSITFFSLVIANPHDRCGGKHVTFQQNCYNRYFQLV